MRKIDADALQKEIEEEIEAEKSYDDYDKGVTTGLRIALRDIKKQPTIETEPDKGWIGAEDRLPDKSQKVLVFYKALGQENNIHNDVMATNWRTKKGDFIPCDGYKVTHWRPLPEPPKGE